MWLVQLEAMQHMLFQIFQQPQPTARFWKRKSNERAQHAVKKKTTNAPKRSSYWSGYNDLK